MKPTRLKAFGYGVSAGGIASLGYVSWETVPDRLHVWLLYGMCLSIIGMLCRWISYVKDVNSG